MHPCLNYHLSERPISRENAAKHDILGNLCNPCMSVCMHFFEHHRGSHPSQPSRCLVNSIAPILESLHPYLNHHFFRHHGRGCRPRQPPRYALDFLQRFNCTPSLNHQFFEHHGGARQPPPTPPPPVVGKIAPNVARACVACKKRDLFK